MNSSSASGFHKLQLSESSFNVPLSQVVKSQMPYYNGDGQFGSQVLEKTNLPLQGHSVTPPAPPRVCQNYVQKAHQSQAPQSFELSTEKFNGLPGISAMLGAEEDTSDLGGSPQERSAASGYKATSPVSFNMPFSQPISQMVQSQNYGNKWSTSINKHNKLAIVPPAPSSFLRKAAGQPVFDQRTKAFKSQMEKDELFKHSENPGVAGIKLRSVEEIPRIHRDIFSFPYFNILQSLVLDEALYTDKSLVASAPTGSGKTVIFELAIIRILMKAGSSGQLGKIIYMAPMKALCSEKFTDWSTKFGHHNLNCLEVTGDSELDDLEILLNAHLICTTPEKWDSMSRRWKDNKRLFQDIQLFLIDEIHTLNDPNRGATVEAVVSRMKTLQISHLREDGKHLRFVAVSATMPNYNDIAEWLGSPSKPASAFNLGQQHRPVKLDRLVLGYPFKEGTSDFCFDMNLSYRLRAIIQTHSHGKPTLVFCSSRKSVVQSAEILAKDMRARGLLSHFSPDILQRAASTIHEHKLAELLQLGIGIHHAGLDTRDRHTVEDLFRSSQLPVLISTSTLAMGVNLPAHLVIVKSTHFYNMGVVQEYSDMQILQMIGRAGRPQFDTSATAVIMTKSTLKSKYESLINGTQLIESSLHKNLIEHLNAEIVLQTISEMAMAVEWIRHTFLYIRVLRNPRYYGLPSNLSRSEVEKKLKDLCLESVNQLRDLNLVSVNEKNASILPTDTGRLMARYCIAFKTMKQFHSIADKQESIPEMLILITKCSEFEEIQLRTNEKRILNSLNKDKNKETIRFPMPGKIKTKYMKINCLIQAQLSCLPVQDFSLSQDMAKIFRVGQRVTKCLMEFMYQGASYSLLLHSILIYKAFKSKLWYDSRYVARQLDGIGPTMSLALANAGMSSFQKLEQANPRDIELIVNRHPPFGNLIKEAVSVLPKYELAVEQMKGYKSNKAVLVVSVDLLNRAEFETQPSCSSRHQSILMVGDAEDQLVFKWRVIDAIIIRDGTLTRTVEVKRSSQGIKLNISLLSQDWVGLDIQMDYEPVYTDGWFEPVKTPSLSKGQTPASKLRAAMEEKRKTESSSLSLGSNACNHKCLDKAKCGHKCCKSVKRAGSATLDPTNAKVSRDGSNYKIESKCMRDTYHILEQQNGSSNQSRLSLRKVEQSQKQQDPSSMSDKFKHASDIWEQDLTILDDDICFSESDFVNQMMPNRDKHLQQYCSEATDKGAEVSRNLTSDMEDMLEKEVNGNIDDECTSDVIILDEMSMAETDSAETYTGGNRSERCAPDMAPQSGRENAKHGAGLRRDPKSNNLDVTVNGWADLDVFHTSRQELFKNGRPLCLQEDAWSDEELPTASGSPHLRVDSCFEIEKTSPHLATTTSSDEELCQLVDNSSVPVDDETALTHGFTYAHQTMAQRCGVTNKSGHIDQVHFRNESAKTMAQNSLPWAGSSDTNHADEFQGISCNRKNSSDKWDLLSSNSFLNDGAQFIDSPSVVIVHNSDSTVSDDCMRQEHGSLKSSQLSPAVFAGRLSQSVQPIRQTATPIFSPSPASKSDTSDVSCCGQDKPHHQEIGNIPSSQQNHQYGRVKAWKKNAIDPHKTFSGSKGTRHSGHLTSKFFVPKTKISGSETPRTDDLFEGIF